MGITARAAGAWAYAASGSVTTTLPTHASGDMLLVRVAAKSSNIASLDITTATSGWARVGQFRDGTTNSGNGTGSVQVAEFWKQAASASETNPTIDFSQTVTQVGHVGLSFQKGASDPAFIDPVGDGGGHGGGTSFSATIQTHVSVVGGDMVVAVSASRDDTAFTVPTFTQAGITFAAVTEFPATAGLDASGADGSYDSCYRLASSGTSSAAAVVTGTLAATETGSAWQTRLRLGFSGSFTANAILIRTISGSASADAVLFRTMSGSVAADAVLFKTQSGSLTADAWLLRVQPGSATANAVLFRTISGTFTADAIIKREMAGSATANAVLMRTASGSLTADSVLFRTQSGSLTADAVIKRTQTGSFTADAVVDAGSPAIEGSFTANAVIGRIGRPVWTTPADMETMSATPALAFLMPIAAGNMHFHIELDKVATFDGPDLRSYKSNHAQTSWEYWDGAWLSFPSTGVDNSFTGNEARLTITNPLSAGTWYRRVRGGA